MAEHYQFLAIGSSWWLTSRASSQLSLLRVLAGFEHFPTNAQPLQAETPFDLRRRITLRTINMMAIMTMIATIEVCIIRL